MADVLRYSIVIPVWNRERVLHRAIESVLQQGRDDVELIVVDDASQDSSYALAKRYEEKNSAIRVVRNTRTKGAQGARNTGTLLAGGKWIGYLDSDNEYKPGLFAAASKLIDDVDTDVVCWYSDVRRDGSGEQCGEFAWRADGIITQRLLDGSTYVDNSSCFIRRSRLLEVGLLDEECPSYQEYDTHIRLSHRCSYRTLSQHFTVYYRHNEQLSADPLKDVLGMLYVLRKHRQLWCLQGLANNWAKRCCNLRAQIAGLPEQRTSCFLALLSLEPRLPWLLLRTRASALLCWVILLCRSFASRLFHRLKRA